MYDDFREHRSDTRTIVRAGGVVAEVGLSQQVGYDTKPVLVEVRCPDLLTVPETRWLAHHLRDLTDTADPPAADPAEDRNRAVGLLATGAFPPDVDEDATDTTRQLLAEVAATGRCDLVLAAVVAVAGAAFEHLQRHAGVSPLEVWRGLTALDGVTS